MIIEEFMEGNRTYKFSNDRGFISVQINNQTVLTGYTTDRSRSGTRASKIRTHGNTLIDISRVRDCYNFMLSEMGL